MTPIIVKAKGGGYVIYMRPGSHAQKRQLDSTHGTQFDPIERHHVTGGIPVPMARVDIIFGTKKEALAAIAA